MPRFLALLTLWVYSSGTFLFAQTSSKLTLTPPKPAAVAGRVTVYMTVGRIFGEHPVADFPLYLLRVEDGKTLQDLQRKCRRALARTSSDPAASYEICMTSLAEAARTVPQMAVSAATQTDSDGQYRFEDVPAGGRYQVVGVRFDGEDPVVIVGLTARLRPGEQHKMDLSENSSWTDALPGGR